MKLEFVRSEHAPISVDIGAEATLTADGVFVHERCVASHATGSWHVGGEAFDGARLVGPLKIYAQRGDDEQFEVGPFASAALCDRAVWADERVVWMFTDSGEWWNPEPVSQLWAHLRLCDA